MNIYLAFSHDEIPRELPYMVIGEMTSRSVWDTGKRRRRWSTEFTEQEREACYKIIKQAKRWLLGRGIPDEVKMTTGTFALWQKLGNFCASL